VYEAFYGSGEADNNMLNEQVSENSVVVNPAHPALDVARQMAGEIEI
jgi:hypothetical protein